MEGSLQSPISKRLQPVDFLPLLSLRFGGVCSSVVVKERFKIVPAAPVADYHRINVGAAELGCPRRFDPGLGFLLVATHRKPSTGLKHCYRHPGRGPRNVPRRAEDFKTRL